jgi:hypothetical protein
VATDPEYLDILPDSEHNRMQNLAVAAVSKLKVEMPVSDGQLDQVTDEQGGEGIHLIKRHHIVDAYANEVTQNNMCNAIGDDFFDIVRDAYRSAPTLNQAYQTKRGKLRRLEIIRERTILDCHIQHAEVTTDREVMTILCRCLNVATSRAKCICILVASPSVFEAQCRTPRQMHLANAFCQYLELTTVI